VGAAGPGGARSRAGDIIAVLRGAHAAAGAARARGDTAPGPEVLHDPRQRYDTAVRCGITHSRLRDRDTGNHPGCALGCRPRGHKEQAFLLTRESAASWTDNVSERGARAAGRHQAASGYWHSPGTLARWCRLRSHPGTAAAHGTTALDAIRAAIEGKPRQPPLAAIN
jgi:hypothetical protein